MLQLFVYGIFLDEKNRNNYGMTNPRYNVVENYATFSIGNMIVKALPVASDCGAALTGLTVDVDPSLWPAIDELEFAYTRKIVKTVNNQDVYMYVGKELA